MDQPVFRSASVGDLDRVMAFYRSYIGTPGCTWDENYPTRALLLADHESGSLFGLYLNGLLVGSVSISKENYMDDLPCWKCRSGAKDISRVVISPQYQGQHYGTALLQKTCSYLKAQNVNAIHLLVSPTNKRALQLYYSQQFKNRGIFFLYGHDYLALEKIL